MEGRAVCLALLVSTSKTASVSSIAKRDFVEWTAASCNACTELSWAGDVLDIPLGYE